MIKNLTFGSDPEYFIINESNGRIVSSIPIIDGTKDKPEPLGDGFFILKDNILAEGNIPPSKTREGFTYNMQELSNRITEYIKNKYPTLGLLYSDCETIDMAFLSHPEAMQFGCSPYFNAWDNMSHRANDLSSEDYRTCGAHAHIGYDLDGTTPWNKETVNVVFAKAFDLFLTIPSYFANIDKRRFENYGGLGQYRDTPYGLECRSLGGYFSNPKYSSWIFDQILKLVEFINNEENFYKLNYMSKPNIGFDNDTFIYDLNIYHDLNISFDNQLITTKKTIYV